MKKGKNENILSKMISNAKLECVNDFEKFLFKEFQIAVS
jgi:hypothetical protein